MKNKAVHSERINFLASPKLKKSIEIAAHAHLGSVSDYIRSLIYKDLHENSDGIQIPDTNEAKMFYIVKHKLDN